MTNPAIRRYAERIMQAERVAETGGIGDAYADGIAEAFATALAPEVEISAKQLRSEAFTLLNVHPSHIAQTDAMTDHLIELGAS